MEQDKVTEMIAEIKKDPRLKKSPLLAKALADDFFTMTGSVATVHEGKVGRISRFTGKAYPGYFVKANTFKVSWLEFLSLNDAENYVKALNASITEGFGRGDTIKNTQKDYGILQLLALLHKRQSPLSQTIKVYTQISRNIKYGLN